jgi:ABC-type glycerol-3-phosphate transport system substrate-binding protein
MKRIAIAILIVLGLAAGAGAAASSGGTAGVSATHVYGSQPNTHVYG